MLSRKESASGRRLSLHSQDSAESNAGDVSPAVMSGGPLLSSPSSVFSPGATGSARSSSTSSNSTYTSAHTLVSRNASDTHLSTTAALQGDGAGDDAFCTRFTDPSTKDGGASMTKLTKRESYKAQRRNYRREKKRVANELFTMLKDPAVIILADWLKVRGTLKGWTKLWCVLKPGLLLLYKSPKTHKSSHWVGTVLLTTCELIERPSKKDGFCFKLFHPMEQSIWATRGPGGETMGAMVQPLPTAYLIFRAPSEAAGKCWMDGLELALRCSNLLIRSMSREGSNKTAALPANESVTNLAGLMGSSPDTPTSLLSPGGGSENNSDKVWNESDYEQHFQDQDLEDDNLTTDENDPGVEAHSSDTDSDGDRKRGAGKGGVRRAPPDDGRDSPIVETPYTECGTEEFGVAGDAGQTEEVAEENKSLIWTLVKQVRPGMDLSKVVLPTFILEPRSFLDKLTDYYYHADILSKAVLDDDPYNRMKLVTQWYLSGFYKKSKGLKKPYNPILGEVFRCYWQHHDNTRTFYISEQVSHHPPVSVFHVTNRKAGYAICGTILAKSKFYGNSLSAILDGRGRLTFLTRGEVYTMNMPYAHCKGILVGTLTLELGGKVNIECEKTGYRTELEFKLKPLFGGAEYMNAISGKIKLGKETLANIDGHWDQDIYITDKKMEEKQILWSPTPEMRSQRLKRFTVPFENQNEFESERLWQRVSSAIVRCDQAAATEEKTVLEDAQRAAVKERKAKCEEWIPRFFTQDLLTGDWQYKHAEWRPWDPRNDVLQYECDCVVTTKTRHRTPVVRASSIIGMDETVELSSRPVRARHSKTMASRQRTKRPSSRSSSPDNHDPALSDSSDSATLATPKRSSCSEDALLRLLKPIQDTLKDHSDKLDQMQRKLANLSQQQQQGPGSPLPRELILLALLGLLQAFIYWFFHAIRSHH